MRQFPLDERLGHLLKRVEQQLMAVKTAAVRPSNLTVPQYAALLVLADNPGISSAALARECLVTPATMGAVVANLEEKGLVERRQNPWHRQLLETRLTDRGKRVLDEADARVGAIEQGLRDEFTPTEVEQLRAFLARCSNVLTAPSLPQPGASATRAGKGPRDG